MSEAIIAKKAEQVDAVAEKMKLLHLSLLLIHVVLQLNKIQFFVVIFAKTVLNLKLSKIQF